MACKKGQFFISKRHSTPDLEHHDNAKYFKKLEKERVESSKTRKIFIATHED
jgi:hypothetical protein